MADSVAQVARTRDLLRSWGFTVVEVDGWANRGSGNLTTTGRLEHHTAGARDGDAPSLRVVTFGRAGLRNALCRWFVSRSGVIYLVARRSSWHAGRGDKGSNATLSGTEAENTGTGEPWGARSLEAQAAISAAEAIVYGFSPQRVWDHKEHATPRGRKIDRTGIAPHPWRERVAALVASGGSPAPPPREDETMYFDERSGAVKELQNAANLFLRLSGGGHDGGGTPYDAEPEWGIAAGRYLKVDGHLHDRTVEGLWHCMARMEIRLKRSSFGVDIRNPSPTLVGYLTAENNRMLAERLVANGAAHSERGAD